MLPSIIQGANIGCDYVIVFYKQPHSSLLKYFSSKSIYGLSSTWGHILVYNYFQSESIKNLISYLERKHFFYLYVIFRSDMSNSYRDTQGGGSHRPPPQVVNCPNHPRLDRVKADTT